MKLTKKGIIVSSIVAVVVVGGGSALAISNNRTNELANSTPVVKAEKPEVKVVETKEVNTIQQPQVQSEPVVQSQTVEPTVEEPPQETQSRSYETLIADYGFTLHKAYMDKLKEAYPERFTDDAVEDTFAYIDRVYFDAIAAHENINLYGWDVLR